MKAYQWELAHRPSKHGDGHSLFACGNVYSLADGSGSNPSRTDDGPLWLDLSRPILVMAHEYSRGSAIVYAVPVTVDRTGEQSRVWCNDETMAAIERCEPRFTMCADESFERMRRSIESAASRIVRFGTRHLSSV